MNAPIDALWPTAGPHDPDPVPPPLVADDTTLQPTKRTRQAVLVVDDDREIRNVLRDLFGDEGYRVYEAADGAEGLRMLGSATAPLVMLLDLMMPGVDGYEVCRQLAADPHLVDSHAVVLMSARRNLQAADCRAVQATIAKPFEIDEMVALVEHLATQPLPAPPANSSPPAAPPTQ